MIRRKHFIEKLLWLPLVTSLSNCGLNVERKAGTNLQSDVNAQRRLAIYQDTIYAYVRANCIDCHRQNIQPLFASDDLATAWNQASAFINSNTPADSVFVTQTKNGHCDQRAQCLTDGSDMAAQVQAYVDRVRELGSSATEGEILSTAFALRTQELDIPSAVFSDVAFHVMSWDLSTVSPLLAGATFEVEVQRFDPTTYLLQRPRINTGGNVIHIANVKILLNGKYNLANNHFTSADRIVPAYSTGYLSTALPIIAQGIGQGDILGFAFETIEAAASPTYDTSGLVSFWKFDEVSGNRMDSIGSNHLAVMGTAARGSGLIGKAVQFDAAGYLERGSNPELAFGKQNFSTSGWVYFDSTPTTVQGMWGKGNSGNAGLLVQEWVVYFSPGSVVGISSLISDGSSYCNLTSGITPPAKTWTFVVAWYDAALETFYLQVNGGPVKSVSCTSGPSNRNFVFSMGRVVDNLLRGRLDSVGVWSKVLSASERANLYNSGLGSFFPF